MQRWSKQVRALALASSMALVLMACGGDDDTAAPSADDDSLVEDQQDADEDDRDDDGADVDEDDGDARDAVSIAVANFPPSAEPWTGVGSPGQYIWSAVFDALTVIGEDGSPQPALAESWESIDDTTWEFTLRDDVEFHDGSPLTASDVEGTFELLLSEEGAASYASHVGNYGFIQDVTAVDDQTVQIETASPAPLLPAAISIVYIVPIEHFDEVGAESFATEPIGTGPYASTSWGSDRIQLERYENSWREANVTDVEFVNLNDPAARTAALQSGQVDIIISVSADATLDLEEEGFDVFVAQSGRLMALAFVTNEGGPLEDQRVRQALNYAVDKDAIAEQLVGGLTSAAAWPPEGVNGHDPSRDPYPYDPDRARELLEEAGHGDGFDISAEVTLGAFPADREIYEAAAGFLSEVGVNLTLTEIDFAQEWLPKYTGSGGADWEGEAFGSTWVSPPLLDGVRPLTQYRCDWQNQWFCDEELDALLDEVNTTLEPDDRDPVLEETLDRVWELAPALYLVELVELWVSSPEVSGWETYAFNPTFDQLR